MSVQPELIGFDWQSYFCLFSLVGCPPSISSIPRLLLMSTSKLIWIIWPLSVHPTGTHPSHPSNPSRQARWIKSSAVRLLFAWITQRASSSYLLPSPGRTHSNKNYEAKRARRSPAVGELVMLAAELLLCFSDLCEKLWSLYQQEKKMGTHSRLLFTFIRVVFLDLYRNKKKNFTCSLTLRENKLTS